MASIIEIYEKGTPKTGTANTKGVDKTPIEADGGRDLSKDERRLEKSRGGKLNLTKYSDTVRR